MCCGNSAAIKTLWIAKHFMISCRLCCGGYCSYCSGCDVIFLSLKCSWYSAIKLGYLALRVQVNECLAGRRKGLPLVRFVSPPTLKNRHPLSGNPPPEQDRFIR
jgi:hypothetical protein